MKTILEIYTNKVITENFENHLEENISYIIIKGTLPTYIKPEHIIFRTITKDGVIYKISLDNEDGKSNAKKLIWPKRKK